MGGICARVGGARSRRSTGGAGSTVLRSIGVDETGYKNGHKYMTVVVDHDRGRVVWACAGHGYLPKEGLRAVFRAGPGRAAGELDRRAPGRAGAGYRSSSSSPGRSGASATGSCAPSRSASPTPAWRP